MRQDSRLHSLGEEGQDSQASIALCHHEALQLQLLSITGPEEMEMLFFCLLAEKTTVLLCPLYQPQWQNSAPLSFLTDELDTIMATHSCQNVEDLNQHLVR